MSISEITSPAVLPSTATPVIEARIGQESEEGYLVCKLRRNQVEPVGAVSRKKLPLSMPLLAGLSVSPKLDYTCVAAEDDDRQLVNFLRHCWQW